MPKGISGSDICWSRVGLEITQLIKRELIEALVSVSSNSSLILPSQLISLSQSIGSFDTFDSDKVLLIFSLLLDLESSGTFQMRT